MTWIMTILFAWLLADLISGIAHWAEDRLLISPSRFKFLEILRADNDLHHSEPAAMLKFTISENINTSVVIAWPLSLFCYMMSFPTVIWLAVFFASFGNLVHRFAHTPPRKLNSIVRFFQKTGLLLSFGHHFAHHFDSDGVIEKKNSQIRFCVMTNWLNPLLDKIRFFRFLEWLVE